MTTNYEWIKNMTVEEMAEFMDEWFACCFCEFKLNFKDSFYPSCIEFCNTKRKERIKRWLQAESEE